MSQWSSTDFHTGMTSCHSAAICSEDHELLHSTTHWYPYPYTLLNCFDFHSHMFYCVIYTQTTGINVVAFRVLNPANVPSSDTVAGTVETPVKSGPSILGEIQRMKKENFSRLRCGSIGLMKVNTRLSKAIIAQCFQCSRMKPCRLCTKICITAGCSWKATETANISSREEPANHWLLIEGVRGQIYQP